MSESMSGKEKFFLLDSVTTGNHWKNSRIAAGNKKEHNVQFADGEEKE